MIGPCVRYIDLFCGIGGFRIAAQRACAERELGAVCVMSSDIDADAIKTYAANFGEPPRGDITRIAAEDVPDHDLLCAGFPCQPFSVIGFGHGFDDARGTLFFDIARILETKRPASFVLENVKRLTTHNGGRTIARIAETLRLLGYTIHITVLDARDFGLPQKRERVFIVGFREPHLFAWPVHGGPSLTLDDILDKTVPDFYHASTKIKERRAMQASNIADHHTIWHENKAGLIGVHPFSCALRADASYNYLLVNGERRLTEREMLRLQGFPKDYKVVQGYSAMRKLTGNSVAVPVVEAVIGAALDALNRTEVAA